MRKDRVIVLITSVGNFGVGSQIYEALRECELQLEIIGTDCDGLCYQKETLDAFYNVPAISDDEYSYDRVIKKIVDTHKVDIIFVGSEKEIFYYVKNSEYFKKNHVYIAINDKKVIDICSNKEKTYRYLEQHGLKVPKYKLIHSESECKDIDFFPVVIKPNRDSGGSSDVFIIFEQKELMMFVGYYLKSNNEIMIQQYVGDGECEYTIGVTSDINKEVCGCIILKRNLHPTCSHKIKLERNGIVYYISSGISQGYILHDTNIEKQAKQVAEALGSIGSINIQCRVCNGTMMILEINPRISGSVAVRAKAGYNEPENIIRKEILNESVDYMYHDVKVMKVLNNIVV